MDEKIISSTPTLNEFDPRIIPFQKKLINLIRSKLDYSDGTVHEILCSGSLGSSKSLVGAHIVITHCLLNNNARVLIGRASMPSLKDTILKKILDHLGNDTDYSFNKHRGIITFPNGSEIIPYSWGDQNYEKVRSLELSCALIEELTENDNMDFYKEIRARVGRQPHIKESFLLSLTNPGSPASDFYKYFINPGGKNRHVLYSLTDDNVFLPKGYVQGLRESYDEKMARRMLGGEWIEIGDQTSIYYAYKTDINFINKSYVVNKSLPVVLSYDFNIASGKPLSLVLMQYSPSSDEWHIFNEIIIDGQRTLDSLDEMHNRGLFDMDIFYKVRGDASGRSRDTRSIKSDYDIIDGFLSNYSKDNRKLRYQIEVPRSNPPIRERHNIVNGYCRNANGKSKLFVYKDAKTVDEGFRLTKLRSGSQYLENDSDRFQHCTTAVGYAVMYEYYKKQFHQTATSRSGSY